MQHPEDRYLRWPAVEARVPFSRSTARRLEKQGRFPKGVRIGARIVAWRASEIEAFIASNETGAIKK